MHHDDDYVGDSPRRSSDDQAATLEPIRPPGGPADGNGERADGNGERDDSAGAQAMAPHASAASGASPSDRWAKKLVAGEPVAAAIVDGLSEQEIEAIACHPELGWTTLREQPDRDAAVRLFEHRVQALLATGEWAAVVDDLDSRELARDAAGDGDLAAVALRAATTLAWFDPTKAHELNDRIATEDTALSALSQRVLLIAPEWRALRRRIALPRSLARFVFLQWVASESLLDDLIGDLRRDMTARSNVYLEVFDAMAEDHYRLLLYIVGLSERFLPEGPPSLGDLGEEERRLLISALEEIDAPMSRTNSAQLCRALVGAVTAGALLSLGGYDTAAAVTVGSLVAAVLAYKVWSERGMYGRLVRPRLAAYLAKVGTPTSCVASWLGQNQKTVKKIKAFNVAIDADAALSAIARLGRMTRHHLDPVAGN